MAEDADDQAEIARQDEERQKKQRRDAEATRPPTTTYQTIQLTPSGTHTAMVDGRAPPLLGTALTLPEQEVKCAEIVD